MDITKTRMIEQPHQQLLGVLGCEVNLDDLALWHVFVRRVVDPEGAEPNTTKRGTEASTARTHLQSEWPRVIRSKHLRNPMMPNIGKRILQEVQGHGRG